MEQQPVTPTPQMDDTSLFIGLLALLIAGLSFFITNFILGIVALVLALVPAKKSGLHIIAIILAVLSLLIDISILNSYY